MEEKKLKIDKVLKKILPLLKEQYISNAKLKPKDRESLLSLTQELERYLNNL